MTPAQIEQRLIQVARQPVQAVDLGPEVEAFLALPEVEASDLLCRWHAQHPEGTQGLLREIRRNPGAGLRSVGVFLRAADYCLHVGEIREEVEEILRGLLPALEPAMRSAVLAIYPGSRPASFRAGVDFLEPRPVEEWPHDRNFPRIATTEGRQARLRYLGYAVEDPPGTAGISTKAALIRYQVAGRCPQLGVWDAATLQRLDLEAFTRMCENREDPSGLFS